MRKDDRFPFNIFFIYVVFYAGQAMYNTYLNLFLMDSGSGFDQTKIGLLQSAATIVLILIQPLWGILSDKSKSKNQIIGFLVLLTSIVCLSFYAFSSALWLSLCVMMFSVFFYPAMTLQDNYTLELLEDSKWDFGNIRLGGTLGYATCAAVVGYIIKTFFSASGENQYKNIFWMMACFFFFAGVMYFFLPKVEGHRKHKEKVKYTVLLKDKPLVCMLIFNITYFVGTAFFFQFYPIYFNKELGASSQMVGMLSFASAMSEIPFFWYAYKIEKKFGVEKVMLFAGTATALRWFLLFFVSNHYLILLINMLSGCGYVGFSYCLIKYINDTVPKSMKATAQSLNAILGTVVSRIIFAPIGGYLSDLLGVRNVLIIGGVVMLAGVVLFKLTFSKAVEEQKQKALLKEAAE